MTHRILVVGEYGSINGGENSFLAVAPALVEKNWTFQAAVPLGTDFSAELAAIGFTVNHLPIHDPSGERLSQTAIRDGLANLIEDIRPDLVHCNSLSISRLMGPVAHALKVPSLGYLRDILKLSKQAITDLNQLDQLIAVSQATRDFHCDQGLNPDKSFVIYNGVDTDKFHPREDDDSFELDPIREELQIDATCPILLYVGQIGIRKGVDILVDSFSKAVETIPNLHLLIVGQCHSKKEEAIEFDSRVRAEASGLATSPQIHWLGIRNDVPELMRSATLLVHLARQEPLGRVLLEAAASGLPMVTTQVGGTPEILDQDAFRPMLVPPEDALTAANRIRELLGDEQLRQVFSRQLRLHAQSRFSIRQCAEQLDQHYQSLL